MADGAADGAAGTIAVVRFSDHIVVSRPAAEAFRYIADFENTADWDPGIAGSRKLTDGPVRVGSQFDVIAVFRGKRQQFRYTVTELEDGRRIVLEGVSAKARSVDAITVDRSGDGSRISYTADVRLRGFRRIAEPLLQPMLAKTGEHALAGLQRKLDHSG